jgi:DNA-binding response OmpR family regulator
MSNRVLIIDDETDFCMIMKLYFAKKKFDVSVAHFLKEGLQLIEEFQPTILFLDNNLPDGYGWDLVDTIVQKFPHIRVFLVSAHRKATDVTQKPDNMIIWEKPISRQLLDSHF